MDNSFLNLIDMKVTTREESTCTVINVTLKLSLLVIFTLLSTAGTGLTDVVEKTCIIFVGTPLRSATNWFVAKKEEDIMRHLIQVFVPPRGILLELGNSQIQGIHEDEHNE